MTTTRLERRPRRASATADGIALALRIQETTYGVDHVPCAPDAARRLYRLRKPDGTWYDVVQTEYGPECDCPDFIYRRAGLDPAGCKHVRALVAFGLIENPDAGLHHAG